MEMGQAKGATALLAASALLWGVILAGYLTFADKVISGRVLDELSRQPVGGAQVMIGQRQLVTDEHGRYRVRGVRVGSLPILARADGYLTTQGEIRASDLFVKEYPVDILLRPNQLIVRVLEEGSGLSLSQASVVAGSIPAIGNGRPGEFTLRRLDLGMPILVRAERYEPAAHTFEGQTEIEVRLRPITVEVTVRDQFDQQPIAQATLSWPAGSTTSDAQGRAQVRGLLGGESLYVQAPGYVSREMAHSGERKVTIDLRPNRLAGVVIDAATGAPVAGGRVLIDGQLYRSGPDGTFDLRELSAPNSIVVLAPGYRRAELASPGSTQVEIALEPFQARGLYITFGFLSRPQRVRELIDLVDRSSLNAIVVDVKGDTGWLAYPSQVPLAQEIGASIAGWMSLDELISLARERGIYTIARLVIFKDELLASRRPDLAVLRPDRSLWRDSKGTAWVDPFRPEVWEYNIAIAREVAALGFDEIQVDYIRFPSDGQVEAALYSQPSTAPARLEAIRQFMTRLQEALALLPVFTSADVFGMTLWVDNDMGIGQMVENVAPYVDYLSPMLYPSTFAEGNLGYPVPALYPYEVVYRSLLAAQARTRTLLRPWLQHYSLRGVTYDLDEYWAQRRAAEEAGAWGWLFWSAPGIYDERLFQDSPPS